MLAQLGAGGQSAAQERCATSGIGSDAEHVLVRAEARKVRDHLIWTGVQYC
jgi:hypothetical protein